MILLKNIKWILTLFLVSICNMSQANYAVTFDYNQSCKEIYKLVIELRFNEATKKIEAEKKTNPDNLLVLLYEDYIDALTVLISESKAELNVREKNKKNRLEKLDKGDHASPYYLLCKAEIELHWAVARMKLDQLPTAAKELHRTYTLLNDNKKKFPDFKPNEKTLSLLQTLLGTVPEKYQWVTNLLGMRGNVNLGMKSLKNYLDYAKLMGEPFYDESILLYSFFQLYIKNDETQAYQSVTSYQLPYKTSLLAAFFAIDIAARTHHTDKALEIAKVAPQSKAYYSMPILHLLHANCLLYNNKPTEALPYFQRYINENKGKHYIKEAYLRMAWAHWLLDNKTEYNANIKKCIANGATLMDADKQALKEAQDAVLPHTTLLKARLYCDGGYYSQAQSLMNSLTADQLDTDLQKIERLYRQGRLFQLTKIYDLALLKYKECIGLSTDCQCYYPAKAQLESGSIYEKNKKDKPKAVACYEAVIKIKNHSFKDSFDQQAKAGINRLK